MKSLFSVLALTLAMSVGAQAQSVVRSKADSRTNGFAKVEEGLLKSLNTFNEVTEQYVYLEEVNMAAPCTAARAVIGFANSVEKDAIALAAQGGVNRTNDALAEAATTFSENVVSARATACAAVNDKCCKRSAQADQSDTCNPKTTKDCQLAGVRIQGCTAASDDCP